MDILTEIEKRKAPKPAIKTKKLYQISNGKGRVTMRLYAHTQARRIVRKARAIGLSVYAAPLTVTSR